MPIPPTPFTITQSQAGSVLILQLAGTFDEAAGVRFQRHIGELPAGTLSRVVLDLGGLHYASSAGIGAIVSLHRRLRSCGGILVLAHPSASLAEMLVTLNLAAIMPVHATVEAGVLAALAAL